MWRKLRIAILLLILLFVALDTYFDRVYSTDWDVPLRVAIFPINGDGSDAAERFVQQLAAGDLERLEIFFAETAHDFGVALERPILFSLAQPLRELPPAIEQNASILSVMWWSLHMRYWAWRTPTNPPGPSPDVKLFLLYHDPDRSPRLPHSMGLQKGLFGIVNAFADRTMAGSNDVVTAHELLHTLGATDKYDPRTTQPLHPDGYAEPERQPLYPQSFAEIMGGRIPRSASAAEIPESLQQVVVGSATAREIGWRER
jgi:hypothetical protein